MRVILISLVFLFWVGCSQDKLGQGSNVSALSGAQSAFACSQADSTILGPGQSLTLTWTGVNSSDTLTFQTSSPDGSTSSPGTATASGQLQATYVAPSTISSTANVSVTATDGTQTASCLIRLTTSSASLGLLDDGTTRGCVGQVYNIPVDPSLDGQVANGSSTYAPPLLSALTPLSLTVVMPNLDVPVTQYTQGFPGQPNLTAWFGIDFRCQINAPVAGNYTFGLNSDDGSQLYVTDSNGVENLIINNWQTQGMTANNTPQITGTAYLQAGMNSIHVPYFQGQPYALGIELFWQIPNTTSLAIVPASALYRPQ